jgi:hypothetical protein
LSDDSKHRPIKVSRDRDWADKDLTNLELNPKQKERTKVIYVQDLRPKQRPEVIYVEQRHDSFESGFSAGFEKGRESSTQDRRSSEPPPRRQAQPTSTSLTTTRTSTDVPSSSRSKSVLPNIFASTRTTTIKEDSKEPSSWSGNTMLQSIFGSRNENASETKSVSDGPRDAPPGILGRSNVHSTPRYPLTTATSTTSENAKGPTSQRSNTMLHSIFASKRKNASETKSMSDRPRDAPLAHSWTLGRSNADSTPRSSVPTATCTSNDDAKKTQQQSA